MRERERDEREKGERKTKKRRETGDIEKGRKREGRGVVERELNCLVSSIASAIASEFQFAPACRGLREVGGRVVECGRAGGVGWTLRRP